MTTAITVADSFPHPTLTAIVGTPTFPKVTLMTQELFANAASVQSSLTHPDLGHAVLVLGAAAYNVLAAANGHPVWADPPRPPAEPNLHGLNSNQALATAKNAHDRAVNDYNAFNNTKSALKKLILAAIEPEYVASLKDPVLGFATVTARQLIVHITQYYGTVTRVDLDANLVTLESAWEPQDSMEGLWKRATDCASVAVAGGETISDAVKIRTMLKVLTNTGLFSLDIRDWNKRTAANRTWDHFKTFFADANKERMANMTAGDFRHQANAALNGTRSGATSPTYSEITASTRNSNATVNLDTVKYCWTHGLYVHGGGHTSRECTYKKTGHQEDANMTNMKGGNNKIRRKPGESNDYERLNRRNNTFPTDNRNGGRGGGGRGGGGRGGGGDNPNNRRGQQANQATQETINSVAEQVLARITGATPIE